MDFIVKLGLLLVSWLGLFSLTDGQHVSILPNHKNVQKFINDSYFVSCQTSDGSHKAEWFNPKSQKIDGNMQNRIRVETSYGLDLFLTRITTHDAGTYSCVTSKGRASFNLNVLRPITFDMSLAEQSASEGQNYQMKCAASGHAKVRIYWKVDNKKPELPKFRLLKDNTLIIHNVTQYDSRRLYMCRAMDMESSVPDAKAMNITLKVKTKPKLVHGARSEHWGVLGEWANLTCAVNAEPPAKFQWLFRNRSISTNDENVILNPQDNISILQVLVRNEGKFGSYQCKAHNDQGELVRQMMLHKGQKPSTPVLQIDIVADDGARIRVREYRSPSTRDPVYEESRGGKQQAGKPLPIVGFVVQYKMMTRSDWTMANATKFEDGFVIRGLRAGITYQIRAAAKNQASVGEYSQPITVITSNTSTKISTATNLHFQSVWTFLTLLVSSTVALII